MLHTQNQLLIEYVNINQDELQCNVLRGKNVMLTKVTAMPMSRGTVTESFLNLCTHHCGLHVERENL